MPLKKNLLANENREFPLADKHTELYKVARMVNYLTQLKTAFYGVMLMSRCLLVSLVLLVATGCSTAQPVEVNESRPGTNSNNGITYPAGSVVWYGIKRGDNLRLIASEVTGS